MSDRAMIEVPIQWVGTDEEDNGWKILWKLRHIYPRLVNKCFNAEILLGIHGRGKGTLDRIKGEPLTWRRFGMKNC